MTDRSCMWAQVLGLTVLAWGNSIGDFSTNMAMARKGLANMALTACYAGPVFNLLVGCLLIFVMPALHLQHAYEKLAKVMPLKGLSAWTELESLPRPHCDRRSCAHGAY